MHTIKDIAHDWARCLKFFDTIQFHPASQPDTHALRLAFELERNKLMIWGISAGLGGGLPSAAGRGFPLSTRLQHDLVRINVGEGLQLVAAMFTPDFLLRKYGLLPVEPVVPVAPNTENLKSTLRSLFKRSVKSSDEKSAVSSTEQSSSKSPSPSTAGGDGSATTWMVSNEVSFRIFIAEAKHFNDGFESLIPAAERDARMEDVRALLDQSNDVTELQALWESVIQLLDLNNSNNKSNTDSNTSVAAASSSSAARGTSSPSHATIPSPQASTNVPPSSSPTATIENDVARLSVRDDDTIVESAKLTDEDQKREKERLEQERLELLSVSVDEQIDNNSKGALTITVMPPNQFSTRATTSVYIDERSDIDHDFVIQGGMVKLTHPAFDLYRLRKYTKKNSDRPWEQSEEDNILFDPEADPKYEHVNPGTVTVDGFALEIWCYEETYGRPRNETIMSSVAKLPDVGSSKLLRRIDELKNRPKLYGWDPQLDEDNMREFFGNPQIIYFSPKKPEDDITNIYMELNRSGGTFATFGSKGEGIGIWNLLWQIILSKELALRLDRYGDSSQSGFTSRVLSSLIVQDLWLQNVSIHLEDLPAMRFPPKPVAPDEETRAQNFKKQGDQAAGIKEYERAVEWYTKALDIEPSNATYRAGRSAALLAQGKTLEALEDAHAATKLQPKHAEAWTRLGDAELKRGYGKKARVAYQRAVVIAGGKGTTEEMRRGMEKADAQVESEVKAINDVEAMAKRNKDLLPLRNELVKAYLDKDFDTTLKTVQMRSEVHERQVEALLLFARRMKWPYMNEMCDNAETAYERLISGEGVNMHMHDWLFGLTLPGHYMAFKIMSALIVCTPSVKDVNVAPCYDCGLYLPGCSYWRLRTVLGSVLAALPGIVSLCGWIGKCPVPEFDPPLAEERAKKPRHIRLKARRVASGSAAWHKDDSVIGPGFNPSDVSMIALQPREGEDPDMWAAEVKDADNWVDVQPPERHLTSATLKTVKLKQLPLDSMVAAEKASGTIDEDEVINMTDYRASLTFELDGRPGETVSYTLYTNPVFVTLPPCHLPSGTQGHKVHIRDLSRYRKSAVLVEQLEDYEDEEEDPGAVMRDAGYLPGVSLVINATGPGEELIARAWCAARGKSAAIRKPGGPCFVCAVGAAFKTGLQTEVLIWSS